jgi:hypothetical protein
MRLAEEIGRILISLMFAVMAALLCCWSMKSADAELGKAGMGLAGMIFGDLSMYWLVPRRAEAQSLPPGT